MRLLGSCSWKGGCEDSVRRIKVCIRDTGLGRIEKIHRIYIFVRKDERNTTAGQSSREIVKDTSPRGLRVAAGSAIDRGEENR
jgi:hypothetical protein